MIVNLGENELFSKSLSYDVRKRISFCQAHAHTQVQMIPTLTAKRVHTFKYVSFTGYDADMGFCEGNPPVTDGFASQRPVRRSFYVFFDAPGWTVKQTVELRTIWDGIMLM